MTCDPTNVRPATGPTAAELKRISRATLLRTLAAASIIIAGVVVIQAAASAFNITLDKPPMPLQKPLDQMSKSLGTPVRYVAEGPDETLNQNTLERLGTNDYLLRRYWDKTQRPEMTTANLHLNLNYYSTGNAAPHVPEICWAGAGMLEAKDSGHLFEIPNVQRKDGSIVTLRMKMISFRSPDRDNPQLEKHVAYMFDVNGDYVATPAEVVNKFWKATARYAYDAKIEVTVGDKLQWCSQAEAQTAITEYIRVALPEIEKCLPDPDFVPPAEQKISAPGISH